MRVETTPEVTGFRKGVRIHSRSSFNGGLWLADVVHMPVGCATWPAFWTHGPGWPNAGEIDILEGVNENSFNQAALHTASGCTLPADFGATGVSATGPNCAALETGNSGCGIRSVESNTYGAGFNENGGGVYAMLWDESAVSIWFFPRGSIPKDVSSSSPQPASWGKPAARWPADTCDPYQFNKDHITIFNTALCGDWAGTSWNASPNGGGPSCAAKTGVATCQEYVQKNGAAFAEAYWQVKNVKIFQK
ncbi:hypothetical protein FRC02_004359 [Tulasnella sp. 418]|nr:hypothetical protein FRC02_004359 [Tulasnella sp. 418]